MYIAVACLLAIVATILNAVIMRYGFNAAPSWSEQVALLLVINVAMFGGAARSATKAISAWSRW